MEELQAFIVRKYMRKEWFSPVSPSTPQREPASEVGPVSSLPSAPLNSTATPAVAFDIADPFAIFHPAETGVVSIGPDPFGDESFDGSSPRRSGCSSSVVPAESRIAANPFDCSNDSLVLDGSVRASAVHARTTPIAAQVVGSSLRSISAAVEQGEQDPFSSAAGNQGTGIQGWVNSDGSRHGRYSDADPFAEGGIYNSADPFGEGDAGSAGSGYTPAWAAEPATKITVTFKAGEPLGLGFAARASFSSAMGTETVFSAYAQPEQRKALFDAYSTAVVRLNSSSGPAAAAGLQAGWIVRKVHGTDLRGVNHSDVLQRIREALTPIVGSNQRHSVVVEFCSPPAPEQAQQQLGTSSSAAAARHNCVVSKGRPLESQHAQMRTIIPMMPATPPRRTSADNMEQSALQCRFHNISDTELQAEARRRGFSLVRMTNFQPRPEPEPEPASRCDELDAFFG
jgi:hypothetical protein